MFKLVSVVILKKCIKWLSAKNCEFVLKKIFLSKFQFVFFAILAVAFAAPQYLFGAPLASPLAYSIPAPYAYTSGYTVGYHAEPVEQHGYR